MAEALKPEPQKLHQSIENLKTYWKQQSEAKPQKTSNVSEPVRHHSTNYFKFSLAGTSTIVLYSFESPWASLCPCANTCCVGGVASARPRRASKRLDCRLWKRDLFHQHNRKGKIVMIETSRYKGLVFGFVFGTWNWYDFWRRSWGLPCSVEDTINKLNVEPM